MKNLTVKIAEEELSILKTNGYALCFSCRDKDGGYDLICRAGMDYLVNTTIGFEDTYQIFCCQSITDKEAVTLATNSVLISRGQKIVLDEAGVFSAPEAGDGGRSLTLINRYGNIYPGYSRKISYGGKEAFLPAFVAPAVSIKGTYTLEPQDTVQVWFGQDAKNSVFMRDLLPLRKGAGRSNSIEVGLADGGVEICYQGGNWKK